MDHSHEVPQYEKYVQKYVMISERGVYVLLKQNGVKKKGMTRLYFSVSYGNATCYQPYGSLS